MGSGLLYIVFLFLNGLFAFMAYYGFVVRPSFMSGGSTTTMWLLRMYESIGPWGPVIIVAVMVVLWVITTPAKILGLGFVGLTEATLRLLPFTLIVSGIASLPSFANSHDYVDRVDFGESTYNLVKRNEMFDTIRYGVIECDRLQTNCRQIFITNELPAALGEVNVPLPQPTAVVNVNGQRVLVAPDQSSTTSSVQPAELIFDTTSSALGIRIANQYQTIAISTPEPLSGVEIVPDE